MAPINKFVLASLCVLAVNPALGAPIASQALSTRQIAGIGSGCNSIFTDMDNGVGYGVEDAEDNTGSKAAGAKGATRRQIAGIGSGCDSVFTDMDNGVGYGVENIEDNTGETIKSGKITTGSQSQNGGGGSSGGAPPPPPAGGAPPPPPPGGPHRRQLNKISNGFGTLAGDAGLSAVGNPIDSEGNTIDGIGTNAFAQAGAEVGNVETSTLEGAGSEIP